MLKGKSLLVFGAMLCCTAVSNVANAMDRNMYVGTNYGIGIANKFDYYEDEVKSIKRPKNSQIFGLLLGYKFHSNIRAELAFNRFHKFKYQYDDKGVDIDTGMPVSTELYTQKISSDAMFINFYFDTNGYRDLKSYANVGLGVSRNKAGNINIKEEGIDNQEKPYVIDDIHAEGSTKSRFAWNIGAGVAYDINKSIILDLISYKYYRLGRIVIGPDMGGDYVKTKLNIHNISTGIRVKF